MEADLDKLKLNIFSILIAMNKFMQLSASLVDEIRDEEMLVICGGLKSDEKPLQLANNSDGRCSGTNNSSGRCGGVNNGSGLCG